MTTKRNTVIRQKVSREMTELRAKCAMLEKERNTARATVMQKQSNLGEAMRQLDELGKRLDREIIMNEALHDRLVLALDGGRPPKGLLNSMEALKPFARLAEVVVAEADRLALSDDAAIVELECRPVFAVRERPLLTVGHFRDALATFGYFTRKKP